MAAIISKSESMILILTSEVLQDLGSRIKDPSFTSHVSFFFSLGHPHVLRDLSSLPRDGTPGHSSESGNPNHWTAREFPAS